MLNFRTPIQLPAAPFRFGYEDEILTMGSCFAQRMGERLQAAKFRTHTNPLGIVYNPISMARLLNMLREGGVIPEIRLSPHQLWHSFDLHSQFSHVDKQVLKQRIDEAFARTGEALRRASLLMLTFGTAYVYVRRDRGEIVTNCHRYPADFFHKKLLHNSRIFRAFQPLFQALFEANPRLRVILTVSPVRHIKEGLPNNNLSKSVLRIACQELADAFGQVDYFPAFEVMMDDLRDYRFYQDDLIHPTPFAETYIWELFTAHYLQPGSQQLLKRWGEVQQGLAHRPLRPGSPEHRKFLRSLLKKIQALPPQLDCRAELEALQQQLG